MILAVRLFGLDPPDAQIHALCDVLDPTEQARAAQFRFDRERRRFVARRGQLRLLLATYLSRPATDLEFEADVFGKPAVRDAGSLRFNLSSSGGIGLCVVARGIEVGCDIERCNPALADPAVADRLFAPAELRALGALPAEEWVKGFFNCWTRKEAFVKALGTGLGHPLRSFAVSVEPDGCAVVRDPAHGWSLHAFTPVPGYHAAVALPREWVAMPSVRWFAVQEALASIDRFADSERFGAESSISAASFSCAASSAVTPPTP